MLEKKKQKRLKVLSKIIYILAKIGKILSYIAIPFVILAMVIVPILMGKIDIKRDRITIKNSDNIIYIVDKSDKITIRFNDEKIVNVTNTKDVVKIRRFLDNNSATSIIVFCECALVFSLVSIILAIILLKHLEKLFKNINCEDTPFIDENVKYIKTIAIILIINIILPAISDIVLGLILRIDLSVTFGSVSIIEILIIFALAYIFEYACKLQEKSKSKIYDAK